MRNAVRALAVALIVALGASAGVSPAVAEVQRVAPGPLPSDTGEAAPQVYEVVANIPVELTNDEQAAGNWVRGEFEKRGYICLKCYADVAPRADVGKCLSGIAAAIGFNLFAAGKVLKLWKLVKDLGGPRKIVDLINKAFARSKEQDKDALDALREVFEEAGQGVGAIAAEVLSIDGILDNCF
ncbi:hypothetical protein [Amycolatopsis sp. 195334CR]|uniref:hypothetical protein n=1 Tax=Amycolatopsis sp. 195334CR TaxID=2814588 RepID=UPI001A8E95AD|nr:hypothetical protein [Amycolatopsis sp. 195334CR]MBN6035326.1 hypothetical protein [Amycolatopsis sp. 195334CR]